MQLKFRIFSKRQKQYVENSCGTHCFSSWAIDPFTGKVVHYTGFLGDESGTYHKDEDPGYYLKGIDFVKESEFVVEQFTGVKDKNGKDIFAGDILKTSGNIGQVFFSSGCFLLDGEGFLGDLVTSDEPDIIKDSEIIGNVNENPEILEEQFATV